MFLHMNTDPADQVTHRDSRSEAERLADPRVRIGFDFSEGEEL